MFICRDTLDLTTPDFAGMACKRGTNGQWWLDWHREYRGWRAAGLQVQASVQFSAKMGLPESTWTAGIGAHRHAYNYGYAYARAFGPTFGTGDVLTMEVGNEPDYSASVYSDILLGMAQGAKAADARMKVLPAIIVGKDMVKDGYLNRTHLRYLDGLNTHTYSWHAGPKGRTATYPENRVSLMQRDVLAKIRFRDANGMQHLPIYVSEWGWDSAGAGEDCDFPECGFTRVHVQRAESVEPAYAPQSI